MHRTGMYLGVLFILAVAWATLWAPSAGAAQVFSQAEIDRAVHGNNKGPSLLLTLSGGTTRTVIASADAYVWGSTHSGENFGDYRVLAVLYRDGSPYYQKYSYIRFDLSSVTGTVISAKLRLYVTYVGASQTLRNTVCEVSDDSWTEYGLTFDNRPSLGAELGSFAPVDETWHEVTVTSAVASALAGDKVLTVGLKANENVGTNYVSREQDLEDFRASGWPCKYFGRAMFSLAAMSFLDSNTVSSQGVRTADRLREHIRNILTPAACPECQGRLANLEEAVVPMTLAIVRHTSSVWNGLTSAEQAKCDLLMKAFAIIGHWGYDDDNNFCGPINFDGTQMKTWNPNHVEGNVDGVIAARIYFEDYHTSGGATYLNEEVFKSFDYHGFVDQLSDAGYWKIVDIWHTDTTSTPTYSTCTYHQNGICNGAQKLLMEGDGQGGTVTDPNGGHGKGVRNDFTYEGHTAYAGSDSIALWDAFGIWHKLATKMYYWDCTNAEYDSIAYIITPGACTPMHGRTGMCFEFRSGDADGVRSCSNYVYLGWNNNTMCRTMLELLGYWSDGEKADRIKDLMDTGTRDFFYKVENGYHAFKLGDWRDFWVDDFIPQGYEFVKSFWDRILAPVTPASGMQVAHVTACADAYVDGGHADTNYGGSTSLLIKGSASVAYQRRAFLQFGVDVELSTLARATLAIHSGSDFTGGNTVLRYVEDQAWREGTITYNNRPEASDAFDAVVWYTEPLTRYEVDVTEMVAAALDASGTSVTFELTTQGDYITRFLSREYGLGLRPELILWGYDIERKELDLGASADAYVRTGSYSGTNFGTATSLAVKGSANPEFNRKAFLKFDFRNEFTRILDARLKLAVLSNTDASLVNALHLVPDVSWGESTITASNQPAAGDGLTTWTPISGQTVEVDLTEPVTDAATTGMLSLAIDSNQDIGTSYGSKENSTAGNRPKLSMSGYYQATVRTAYPAEADAYVRGGTYGDQNWGATSSLTVKGSPNPSYNRQAFIRFNFRGEYANVSTATLTLTPTTAPDDAGKLTIMRLVLDDAWEEDGVTYNNQPALGDAVASWAPAADEPVSIDVTDLVRAAVGRNGRLSIRLEGNTDDVANYGSREGAAEDQPLLEIWGY